MKMNKIFALAIAGLLTMNCLAQDTISKNNMLSLNLGAAFINRQDLIFSPCIHTDFTAMNLGLEYKREAKLFQKVYFNYAYFNPMVTEPYEFTNYGEPEMAYPHNFNFIDLDYLIGKNLKETEKSTLTAGALFTANVQAMNYVYGRFSNFGYFSSFSLGVFARENFTINKKSYLTATIQLPLVAWLARSPYLVNDDEFIENISSHSGFKSFMAFIGDGELVSWGKLQSFDLEAKYSYKLNNKWELGAAYMFEFIHASQPQNLLSFRNSLNLSVNFKF